MARLATWLSVLAVLLGGCESTENKAAGESIAVAVQAYEQDNAHYPIRLEDLVPQYMPAVPKADSKHFVIVYAADDGGAQCWVAYQVHRDRYREYDCYKGTWASVEIEDSHVFRHPNAQYIKPSA